jgi:hypothetical protein
MDAMKSWTPLAPGTALPLDRPWVFLESTVIARGLPWPENLETALAMEAAVQASGAVPVMSPTPALPHRSLSRFPIEEPRAGQKPGTPCPHTCLRAKTVTSTISMSRTRGSGMFWGKIPVTRPVEVASGAGFTRI